MNNTEKCSVLIDQNRNTIGKEFTFKNPSDPQYLTQCDGIPRPTHQQSRMKSPKKTLQHPSSSDVSVISKRKLNSTDGTDPNSSCPDMCELSDMDIQKKRVCLVKLYAWIKDEMTKTAAGTIANYLFVNECKLLSAAAHESIHRCSRRREAVEQLLKKVLMGPSSIYDVFIYAVKLQEDQYIADRLASETVSDEDIAVFIELERSSLEKCERPNHHLPRLTFSQSDQQTLRYHLYDKDIIEQVNDRFLSSLIFSVREHTNVVNCSLDKEKKVKTLIKTMCKCAEDIFKEFCEILVSIEEPHVVQKLEKRVCDSINVKQRKKRKSPTATSEEADDSESPTVKRACMNSTVEYNLVSSIRKSPSKLQTAVNSLGFDIEAVNKGSIVIQLAPKNHDAWLQLEENCRTGKIKDLIPSVYKNEDMEDMMAEGEYRIKFTIYTLPSSPKCEDTKKAMFHLETVKDDSVDKSSKVTTDYHGNLIEENFDLLCEELEITKDLLALLRDKDLVSGNIKQELDKVGSRSKKIKFLLKKLEPQGNRGFEAIRDYVKEQNKDLYKALITREEVKSIDSRMDSVAKVTKNVQAPSGKPRAMHKKEVFFTATLVLLIKKNEKDDLEKRLVTCTDILDPVCHFESRGKESDGTSEQVTLVLEDAWVSNSKKSDRKIVLSATPGKRKSEQDPDDRRKRAASYDSSDDTDEEVINDILVDSKPDLNENHAEQKAIKEITQHSKSKIKPDSITA